MARIIILFFLLIVLFFGGKIYLNNYNYYTIDSIDELAKITSLDFNNIKLESINCSYDDKLNNTNIYAKVLVKKSYADKEKIFSDYISGNYSCSNFNEFGYNLKGFKTKNSFFKEVKYLYSFSNKDYFIVNTYIYTDGKQFEKDKQEYYLYILIPKKYKVDEIKLLKIK